MNTNFFVAEDEVFNPNKVLTRKGMDAFIGDRGIKSYAGVLKKDNKLFYNFIRVKVAEGKTVLMRFMREKQSYRTDAYGMIFSLLESTTSSHL